MYISLVGVFRALFFFGTLLFIFIASSSYLFDLTPEWSIFLIRIQFPCVGIMLSSILFALTIVIQNQNDTLNQLNQVERRIEDTRRRVAALEESPKS